MGKVFFDSLRRFTSRWTRPLGEKPTTRQGKKRAAQPQGRLMRVESLESRQLLTGSVAATAIALDGSHNLVITGNAAGSNLSISYSSSPSQYTISDGNNINTAIAGAMGSGSATVTIPESAIAGTRVIVDLIGPVGDTDTLTINLAAIQFPQSVVCNGGAGAEKLVVSLPAGANLPANGITFNGNAAATSNALDLSGAGQNVTYTADGATAGKGTVSDGTGSLSFTNLTPIDMDGLGTATFVASAGDAPVQLINGVDFTQGGTNAAIRVEPNGVGTQFEAVAFWNDTSVDIDTTANPGSGAVTVDSANDAHNDTNLSIDTAGAAGSISLAGPVVVSGNVTLSAGAATVSETGGGSISAAMLTTTSALGTTLNGANAVSSFNATNAASGDVQLSNTAAPLIITGIDAGGGGDVQITDSGDAAVGPGIVIAGAISDAGHAVSLVENDPNIQASSPDWETYQGDAAHNGYVPVTLNPAEFSESWQDALGYGALNPVAEGDGTVFVSEPTYFGTGGLQALDAATGALRWSTAISNVFSVNPPAYANGMVYIQTGKGTSSPPPYLTAYNANSGAIVFQSTFEAQWENYLAPTPYGGNVYVDGGYYGGMYSFDGTSGSQNWFGGVPQYDGWTPAVDGNYAYAYTGSGDTTPIVGIFTMLNLSTGATAATGYDPGYDWTGYTMNEAVALGTQNDAFVINGGRLLCFTTNLSGGSTPQIAWSSSANFTGQPSVAGGVVYAIDGGNLDAIDESTGQLDWTWSPPSGSLAGTMIVTNNELLASSGDATYAVNLTTHQQDWSYPVGGSLALGENKLYIADSSGNLTAISLLQDYPGIEELGGSIAADSLITQSQTGTMLNGANAVESFNAANYVNGDVQLNNTAAPLTVTGISESDGNVQVVNNGGASAGQGIVITGALSDPTLGQKVTLVENNQDIRELGGSITADSLFTQSQTGTTLDGANAVNAFNVANAVSGDVQLNNSAAPLTIAGISETGGGVQIVNNGGTTTGQGIAVSGAISDPTAGQNVTLVENNQGIQEPSGGSITADSLITQSQTGTMLNGANAVDSFNAVNAVSGDVQLTDTAAPLTITGISETGGNVQIINNGGASVGQGIVIAGGISDATSAGQVTLEENKQDIQELGGSITADSLFTQSQSGTILSGANAVNNFNAVNAVRGDVQLSNTAAPLAITGISETGGDVQIVNNGGTAVGQGIVISGGVFDPTAGESVTLVENNQDIQDLGGSITADSLFTQSQTGTTLDGAVAVNTFNAVNALSGDVQLTDTAAPLTITGISETGGDVQITNNGDPALGEGIVITGAISDAGHTVSLLENTSNTQESDAYWGTYQGNAAHNGYVPVTLDPANFSLAWQDALASWPNAIAEGDGEVFTTVGTTLSALDAGNGSTLWETSLPSSLISSNTLNAPAYANGTVYVESGEQIPGAYVAAFNSTTGSQVFNSPISAQWDNYLAPTPYGGNVFVDGGEYGGMYSFNGTSGSQNWFGYVPQYDGWTPAVDGNYAYAYTGSGDTTPIEGVFTMINLATGATAATVVDPDFDWTGYTMNEAVALGTQNDAFVIDGGQLLCFSTNLSGNNTPHLAWTLSRDFSGQPSVAGGMVYAIDGGNLDAVNEATGQIIWTWSPPSDSLAGTMIVTNNELLASSDSTTYAINLQTHQQDWSYPVGGALALSEGELYITDSNGNLTAIDAPFLSSLTAGNQATSGTNNADIQELGGSITASSLITQSQTGTILNGANAVQSFNAVNAVSGDVQLNNTAAPLTINGINQSGGNVQVINSGGIDVTGPISTPAANGIVSLDDLSAGIDQTGGAIGGNLLITQSVTGTTLNGGNTVDALLTFNTASGDVQFNDTAAPLVIAGITQAGGDVQVINSGGIDLAGSVSVPGDGGIVSLDDTTANIEESGAGAIVAGKTFGTLPAEELPMLITQSVSGTVLNSGNTVSTILAFNTTSGDVQINDSAVALTIAWIGQSGGNVQVINSGTINITGAILAPYDGGIVSLADTTANISESGAGAIGGDPIAMPLSGKALSKGSMMVPEAEDPPTLITQSVSGTILNGENAAGAFLAFNTRRGDVQLTNTTAPLTIVDIDQSGGNVQVTNTAGISLPSGSAITAKGMVTLSVGSAGGGSTSSIAGTIASASQVRLNGGAGANICTLDLATADIPAGLFFNGGAAAAGNTFTILGPPPVHANSPVGTVDNYFGVHENSNTLANPGSVQSSLGQPAGAMLNFANIKTLDIQGRQGNNFLSFYAGTGANPLGQMIYDGGSRWNGMAVYSTKANQMIGVGDTNNPSLTSVSVTTYPSATNRPTKVNVPLRLMVNSTDLAILQMFGGIANVLVNATPVASALLDGQGGQDTLVSGVGGMGSPSASPAGVDVLLGGTGANVLYGGDATNYLFADYQESSASSRTIVPSMSLGLNRLFGLAGYNDYVGASGDQADGCGGTVVGIGIKMSSALRAANPTMVASAASTIAAADQQEAVHFVPANP